MGSTRARRDDVQGTGSSSCSGQHEPPGTDRYVWPSDHSHTDMPQNAPMWVWLVGYGKDAEELPKTASGKVMKHVLREWSAKLAKDGVGQV